MSEGTSSAHLPVPRWTAVLLGIAALGLVPWTLYLTYTLPARHVTNDWNVAWAGFDVAIASALVATAVGVLVCGPWLEAAAAVAATLLVADAWFDVILADGGGERREAILLLVVAELPLALFCLWIALNVERALRAFGARR